MNTEIPTPEIISAEFDGTKTYRIPYRMRHDELFKSLSFNNDTNPIHNKPSEARLVLLSIACSKAFGKKFDYSYCPNRAFDVVAEKIRSLHSFYIAAGVWMSGIFDEFFTFPSSTYPKRRPHIGELPYVKPGCTVQYAFTRYKNPLIIPSEGPIDVELVFEVKQKLGAEHIRGKEVTFKIFVDDYFSYRHLLDKKDIDEKTKKIFVQSTNLDVFPFGTDLEKIKEFYSKGIKNLTNVNPIYEITDIPGEEIKKNISAVLDVEGKCLIHTTKADNAKCLHVETKTTSVSGEDYGQYGVSINRENLGDLCRTISKLAQQTKIPRVLLMAVEYFEKNDLYKEVISSNLRYRDWINAMNDLKSGDKIIAEKAAEKIKSAKKKFDAEEEERRKAIEDYLSIIPGNNGDLEKQMSRRLMVYVEQETLFAPRPHEKDLKLGNTFNMNAILTNYDPKFGGMHYFFVQTKTGGHEEGLLNGEEIMRANTKISSTPLITKELVQYLKDFRLDLDLQKF